MARGSIAEQFAQVISKEIGRRTKKRCVGIMTESAYKLLETVEETRDFYDVTGNLINSIAVGIYYKGKLERIISAGDIYRDPPTRKTLRAGEKYDLPEYYSGEPVHKKTRNGGETRAFEGVVGTGGQSGESAAIRSLRQRKPKGDYVMIVVSPLQYSKYIERLEDHNVLSGLVDKAPFIFKNEVIQS